MQIGGEMAKRRTKKSVREEMHRIARRLFAKLPGRWSIIKSWNSDWQGKVVFRPAKCNITGMRFAIDFRYYDDLTTSPKKRLSIEDWHFGTLSVTSSGWKDKLSVDEAVHTITSALPELKRIEFYYALMSRVVRDALHNHPWVKRFEMSCLMDGGFEAVIKFTGVLPKDHPVCSIFAMDKCFELRWYSSDNADDAKGAKLDLGDPDLSGAIRKHLHAFVMAYLEDMTDASKRQMKRANWFTKRAHNTLKAGPKRFRPQ
jgi:hypothetical protein